MAAAGTQERRTTAERSVANLLVGSMLACMMLAATMLWGWVGHGDWASEAAEALIDRFGSAMFWDAAQGRWTVHRPPEPPLDEAPPALPPNPGEAALPPEPPLTQWTPNAYWPPTRFLLGNRVDIYKELLSLASLWLAYGFVAFATLDSARWKWVWLLVAALPLAALHAIRWHNLGPEQEFLLFAVFVPGSAMCGAFVSLGVLRAVNFAVLHLKRFRLRWR